MYLVVFLNRDKCALDCEKKSKKNRWFENIIVINVKINNLLKNKNPNNKKTLIKMYINRLSMLMNIEYKIRSNKKKIIK
jgi:hypothetical protein